jgi:S1-C subfamily serine protease
MRRPARYSESPRRAAAQEAAPKAAPAPAGNSPAGAWRALYKRRGKTLLVAVSALAVAGLVATLGMRPVEPALTQEHIDAAVGRALEARMLPSPAAKAYAAVRPSVVRVRAGGEGEDADPRAVGSGVVIVESGLILTSLHVVSGASRITVVFADGAKSEAQIVSAQPENDLALIKASVLPDDLKPATLGSSKGLVEGADVVAVGFPFGIGPSVSSGVVSGLKREYRSPQGARVLTDLIQFDAAVNPGSSGGPLVNAAGEVVGVVTAILSPREEGAFAGIGFAVPIQTAAAAAGLPPF